MKKSILALVLVALALGAHATTATPGAVAPAPAAAAIVNVTGASTVAGAPLLLALNGGKAIDPSFQELFDASQTHKTWKVATIKTQGAKARLFLTSTAGKATLEMDVARDMVTGLQLAKGSTIEVETQVSGQSALIKFTKDKTPLGFMVNKATTVSGAN